MTQFWKVIRMAPSKKNSNSYKTYCHGTGPAHDVRPYIRKALYIYDAAIEEKRKAEVAASSRPSPRSICEGTGGEVSPCTCSETQGFLPLRFLPPFPFPSALQKDIHKKGKWPQPQLYPPHCGILTPAHCYHIDNQANHMKEIPTMR